MHFHLPKKHSHHKSPSCSWSDVVFEVRICKFLFKKCHWWVHPFHLAYLLRNVDIYSTSFYIYRMSYEVIVPPPPHTHTNIYTTPIYRTYGVGVESHVNTRFNLFGFHTYIYEYWTQTWKKKYFKIYETRFLKVQSTSTTFNICMG